MASLINCFNLKTLQRITTLQPPALIIKRGTAIIPRRPPKKGTIKHRNLIKSNEDALAARGFLRSHKAYQPPDDVVERVKRVLTSSIGNKDSSANLTPNEKFLALDACYKEFDHCVPNSALHQIETAFDILNFYTISVSTTTPLDELKSKDLPPNLHIQYDYVRFHPDTDTMFNGVTAFPESSTIVTGLKYKKKYRGLQQRLPDHYDSWSDYIQHEKYEP